LKKFLKWAQTEFDLPILEEFLSATPTAELRPITETYVCQLLLLYGLVVLTLLIHKVQSDEEDMGMTYAELSIFGKMRKGAFLHKSTFIRSLHRTNADSLPFLRT
jgi:NAD+ synthase (glutamine-hydrolysing)